MSLHLVKSNFGQCRCVLCGQPIQSNEECPVTLEMRKELLAFAHKHGRMWKHQLKKFQDINRPSVLGQARELINWSRLARLRVSMLENVIEREERDKQHADSGGD